MRKKILICDDNSVFLEIFKFIFKDENLDILTLPDGSELFLTAKQQLPSLIILDLMMPGKDGITALRELGGDPVTAAVPVVVVSSSVNPEIVRQARGLGAREVIEKPFNAVRLREIVRKYLAQGNAAKDPEKSL